MSDTPPGRRAEVGTAISWAFDRLKSQFWPFVGLASVVFGLWIVQQFAEVVDARGVAPIVLAVVFAFLGLIAQAGVYRAAIRSTLGVRASFDALLTSQYLGTYILFVIGSGLLALAGAVPGALIALVSASGPSVGGLVVGLLLAFVGAIVVYFFVQLGGYYVLDKGYGVGEAMRASFHAVSKNIGAALLMSLFAAVVLLLASCCGVFTLVTLPFTSLFTAHLYRQFNGEPIS